MTSTELLDRCIASPGEHLSSPCVGHFQAYELGYASHGSLMNEACDVVSLRRSICDDYGIGDWPQNIDHASIFTALHGPLEDLRHYARFRHRFCRAAPETPAPQIKSILEPLRPGGELRQRPGMYLGNDASAEHLWSLISGLCWAESDAGCPGPGTAFMTGFQSWLAARFSFARHVPWGRALVFLSLGSSSRSLTHFWEYFDFYQRVEPPDCESSAACQILGSIEKQFGPPSGQMEQEIRNQIAPL